MYDANREDKDVKMLLSFLQVCTNVLESSPEQLTAQLLCRIRNPATQVLMKALFLL